MELITTSPVYHLNSTNQSNHNNQFKRSSIASMIGYSLTFILSLLGNGVVIWVTGFKMKKTVNTVWFLNLAVADFFFTAFLPLRVTLMAMDYHWPFGKLMCKLNATIDTLNLYTSVYILVVISVDRCVSVVWPVWAQNHRNVRKASIVCLCVWVLALILSTPHFVFRNTAPSKHNKEKVRCHYNFALSNQNTTSDILFRHQAMTITRCVLGFVIPFTVIVSCYAVIIHRLRRNRTLASQSNRPFKIIAAIILTFFLCWAPFHILHLFILVRTMKNYSKETFRHIFLIGGPIANHLAFLNSCVNPLLYVFMGQDFKDKVRKSILKVLETAFQEEVSRSYTNSMITSRSKVRSFSDTEV